MQNLLPDSPLDRHVEASLARLLPSGTQTGTRVALPRKLDSRQRHIPDGNPCSHTTVPGASSTSNRSTCPNPIIYFSDSAHLPILRTGVPDMHAPLYVELGVCV